MSDYRVFYSPYYYADIGEGHVFPIRKFELVKDRLLAEGALLPEEIAEPEPASVEDVRLVHTEDYVTRLIEGRLTAKEIRKLGLPWSEALVRRSFLACSGTISAARAALETGVASNLAGGTHHAYPDRGEGFCVLNDVAVAIRVLQKEKLAEKFLIVDLDVHQGNGTAAIFQGDSNVFTFSIHGAKNYPLFKENSALDIEMPDRTGDTEYLEVVSESLHRISMHDPEMIFYLAGADPYEKDKLGRLGLTIEGLRARDEMVLEFSKSEGRSIVTTMSGGYALDIEDTVEIHCNTLRAVKKVFFGSR